MIEIFLSSILYYSMGIILFLLLGVRLRVENLIISTVLLSVCTLAASINFEMSIIPQKFASEFSYNVFLGHENVRSSIGFYVQVIYCYIAYSLTGAWWSAIGTNISLTVLFFTFVYRNNPNLAFYVLSPAAVNFSFFALRDPIILVIMFSVTLIFLNSKYLISLIKNFIWIFASLFVRPENIGIIVLTYGMEAIRANRAKIWMPFLLFCLLIFIYFTAPMVPRLLGVEFKGSMLDLPIAMTEFYEARANRWGSDDGGGSNILGGSLPEYPFLLRFAIQVTSFFILPLPFEIRSVPLGLAAVDSVVFIRLYLTFSRKAHPKAKIIFWIYVFSVAIFMNNYGNA
ncbi:hypothetical protein N9M97_02840, partial [Planktomarina temperata]|nr:hypothetical protein [Planktomarina temperata]